MRSALISGWNFSARALRGSPWEGQEESPIAVEISRERQLRAFGPGAVPYSLGSGGGVEPFQTPSRDVGTPGVLDERFVRASVSAEHQTGAALDVPGKSSCHGCLGAQLWRFAKRAVNVQRCIAPAQPASDDEGVQVTEMIRVPVAQDSLL